MTFVTLDGYEKIPHAMLTLELIRLLANSTMHSRSTMRLWMIVLRSGQACSLE